MAAAMLYHHTSSQRIQLTKSSILKAKTEDLKNMCFDGLGRLYYAFSFGIASFEKLFQFWGVWGDLNESNPSTKSLNNFPCPRSFECIDWFRLASYRNARRGQCFAFTDVEGVVRRSRLLSSERAVGGVGTRLPLPAIESSEEEYALCAATGFIENKQNGKTIDG